MDLIVPVWAAVLLLFLAIFVFGFCCGFIAAFLYRNFT